MEGTGDDVMTSTLGDMGSSSAQLKGYWERG